MSQDKPLNTANELKEMLKAAWLEGYEYGWNEAFCDQHTCNPTDEEKEETLKKFLDGLTIPPH